MGWQIVEVVDFQSDATLAIGPSFIGWSLLLLISGGAFQASFTHLHPKTTTFNKKTRIILGAILFLNFFIVILTFYEVFFWGSLQVTAIDALYEFTIPDSIVSIPAGILAAIVQAYFAERAWKVLHKSKIFASLLGVAWVAALAGSIGTAVESLMPQDTDQAYFNVLVVTQVWLWSSAFVDLCISVVLVVSLHKYSEGAYTRANSTFTWILQLSFQTAALTSVFALGAASMTLALYKGNAASVYYALLYPLPSLYTASYLWCLSTVAAARKKRFSSATGNGSSSACPTCQASHFDSWPYQGQQAALPTLRQGVPEGPVMRAVSSPSQVSLTSFLKAPRNLRGCSRAGKGVMTIAIPPLHIPPSHIPKSSFVGDGSAIQVDVEMARLTEDRLQTPMEATFSAVELSPSRRQDTSAV